MSETSLREFTNDEIRNARLFGFDLPGVTSAELSLDETWDTFALCRQVDSEVFVIQQGGSSRAAKRICKLCVVKPKCLEAVLEGPANRMVRAGLTYREQIEYQKQHGLKIVEEAEEVA